MTRPLKVAVINGSPSQPSKTEALAELAVRTLTGHLPTDVTTVSVYRLGPGFTDAIHRSDVTDEVEAALQAVESADLVIASVPVFRASYPGLFKHFMDLIGQYALAGRYVLLLATGGSNRHALVIDHALRPLFAFLQARVLPVGVFASSAEFDGPIVLNPEVYQRLELAFRDVLPGMRALTETPAEGAEGTG